jgi:hypothetical protein
MKPIDSLIKRLNKFFNNHTFTLSSPYYNEENIEVKVKLTGTREMITIGEWSDVIEYTLYIEKAGKISGKILENYFEGWGGNEVSIDSSTNDARFFQLIVPVMSTLRGMLYHFNLENYVVCTKVIKNF